MKIDLRIMMVIIITFLTMGARGQTPDPVWNISEDGYYEISTAQELHNVRYMPEGNFRLMNDIDLTEFLRDKESGWEPIDLLAPDDEIMRYFDGNNHTIRGLWIDRPGQEEDGTGLFGQISQREISNLTLEIGSRGVTGFFSVGGLAGMIQRGSVVDCGVKGGPVKGSGIVGGLVGSMMGAVTRSYSLSDVSGMNMIGGLVGSHSGNMSQSYAMGDVTGSMIVGGLVGAQTYEEGSSLRDSYATGNVMGFSESSTHVGGLVGYQTIPVYNSYAAGKVMAANASGLMGGLAGDSENSEVINTFFRQEPGWNEGLKPIGYWEEPEATGRMNDTGDLPQGITATQFMTASTFPESWNINEGGSEDTPWLIKEGETYPYLWWQEKPYPQPPGQNPGIYHKVSLKVAPGIDLLNYTSGDLVVEDGGHLHLQFLPEDVSLTAQDILFLVDGVETSFKDFGGNHYFSYILNPIREDRTILIALKEYEVTIPGVSQLQSDPVPGVYKAAYGEPFTLTLFPDDNVTLQSIHVYANGIEMEQDPRQVAPSGYAMSLNYTIEQVTGPVDITIRVDNDPVGNIDPVDEVRVYSVNGELIIETTLPQRVQVYNITGALQTSENVNGRLSIPLSKGIYMVKTGDKVHKVVIR